MKQLVRICPECRGLFKPNFRLRERQRTCGKGDCRRLHRKKYQRRWRKLNRAVEQEYEAKRKACRKKDYWKGYRLNHPEYTDRNRVLSRLRKKLKREGLQRKLDIVQVIENPEKLLHMSEFATRHRSIVSKILRTEVDQREKYLNADTGTSG
jgi:hypothetical protein